MSEKNPARRTVTVSFLFRDSTGKYHDKGLGIVIATNDTGAGIVKHIVDNIKQGFKKLGKNYAIVDVAMTVS